MKKEKVRFLVSWLKQLLTLWEREMKKAEKKEKAKPITERKKMHTDIKLQSRIMICRSSKNFYFDVM